MPFPIDQSSIDQLLCLPAGDDLWQLRIARLSEWIEMNPGDERAVDAFVATSRDQRRLGMGEPREQDEPAVQPAFRALLSLANELRPSERPARVELEDDALHAALAPVLAECGIECACVPHVALLDEPIAGMRREITGMEPYDTLYAALDTPRLASFAAAVALFQERRPWLRLSSIDFLQVESPHGDMPAWFSVQGGAGEHHALLFVRTLSDLTSLYDGTLTEEEGLERETWTVGTAATDEMSGADVARWKEDALPRLEMGDLPLAAHYAGEEGFRPVTAAGLDYLEAVLRAVSLATDEQIDSGRWSATVSTAGGDVAVTLALPSLLDDASAILAGEDSREERREWRGEMALLAVARLTEGREFATPDEAQAFVREQLLARRAAAPEAPKTPMEAAVELVHRANAYEGRRRVKLARQALREWSDCADAWVILAEEMPDPDMALECYRNGVQAGERALGAEMFEKNSGHFWSLLETRPYMRARTGMAELLLAMGETDTAFAHLRALLQLDEDDHQGLRYVFLPALLENARFTEANELLEEFIEDQGATFAWARALVAFGESGAGPAASAALAEARRVNLHVAKYLAGTSPLPRREPADPRPGSDDEGQQAALELLDAFQSVPGAVEWLQGERKQARKDGRAKRHRR